MNMSIKRQIIGAVALLCSSAGMAASVTVVPSTTIATVGSSFSITVHGDNFPTTSGATLQLFFNPNVQVTGIGLAPGSPFTGGTVPTIPPDPNTFTSGSLISVLGPLVGTLPSGSFDAFQVTFQATAPGAAGIVLTDDQSDFCWSDPVTFGCIPDVTYTQANVAAPLLPVPTAAWLLGSALGVLGWMKRRKLS